uniref:Protein FAR1-RELATED SEQUENCE n=1 Tax=Arundo donax TaxID=35708 RepID=A0A0A8YGB2_ARUDO
MLERYGEQLRMDSHGSIDQATKDMVRFLRENNVSLSCVNCILGSIYGSMSDVPISKKKLRTVCNKLAKDQHADDIQKTMELFREMKAEDPDFDFVVDLDNENRVRSLMWCNGRSHRMYSHFGEVVTFDTTYQTNSYDMPFGMFWRQQPLPINFVCWGSSNK